MRPYISGPSRSCILFYVFIFTFLCNLKEQYTYNNIEDNIQNNLLSLGAVIADYILFSHTLTEILITKIYELNSDPTTYITKLFKQYNILK